MYDVSYNADNVLYDRQETLFSIWDENREVFLQNLFWNT